MEARTTCIHQQSQAPKTLSGQENWMRQGAAHAKVNVKPTKVNASTQAL
jgi:hypothetical protein